MLVPCLILIRRGARYFVVNDSLHKTVMFLISYPIATHMTSTQTQTADSPTSTTIYFKPNIRFITCNEHKMLEERETRY